MSIIPVTTPPKHMAGADSCMKMHLRVLNLAGRTYRIVTLRPGTPMVFSTNFYHCTWHIVTSQRGARLFVRMLWGLSFERHAGTLLLVHGDHLAPTPFEAERSDPFVVVLDGLTPIDADAFHALKNRLPRLGPPTMTIRWRTFSMDKALATNVARDEELHWIENEPLWRQERMRRIGGLICYSAPAAILREQALMIHRLRARRANFSSEMDYHFLAQASSPDSWYGGGEVQIFADYLERVGAAGELRQQLVGNPRQAVIAESVQEEISRLRDRIKSGRKYRNRQRIARGKRMHGGA